MLFLILIVKYMFRFRLFFGRKRKCIFRLFIFYGRKSKIHFRSAYNINANPITLSVGGVVGQNGRGRKLQFSDRQPNISDRRDTGARNFSSACIPQTVGFPASNCVF